MQRNMKHITYIHEHPDWTDGSGQIKNCCHWSVVCGSYKAVLSYTEETVEVNLVN